MQSRQHRRVLFFANPRTCSQKAVTHAVSRSPLASLRRQCHAGLAGLVYKRTQAVPELHASHKPYTKCGWLPSHPSPFCRSASRPSSVPSTGAKFQSDVLLFKPYTKWRWLLLMLGLQPWQKPPRIGGYTCFAAKPFTPLSTFFSSAPTDGIGTTGPSSGTTLNQTFPSSSDTSLLM